MLLIGCFSTSHPSSRTLSLLRWINGKLCKKWEREQKVFLIHLKAFSIEARSLSSHKISLVTVLWIIAISIWSPLKDKFALQGAFIHKTGSMQLSCKMRKLPCHITITSLCLFSYLVRLTSLLVELGEHW